MPPESYLPRVVVAVGDPRGGNGLAALRVAADHRVRAICRLWLAGDLSVLSAAARDAGLPVVLRRVALDEADGKVGDAVPVIDRPKHPLLPRPCDEAGRAGERIVEDLDAALQMVLFGWADAVAVAPVDMQAVRAAGFHYQDFSSLLREWLRLEAPVSLSTVARRPHLRLVEGLPVVVVLVSLDKEAGAQVLCEAMKESVELAAALVSAKA